MNTLFRKISVIGLGYIGLPTAAMLASRGINVIGVDIDQHVVDTINGGEIHIVESDLEAIVHGVVTAGKFRASTKVESADAFLIAVPTPFINENEPDISFIKSAVKSIAPLLDVGNLIVLESTSPVGTTDKISKWLSALRPDLTFPHQESEKADIQIAYCPERVLPGHIIRELKQNDRVIGGMTDYCSKRAKKLYEHFVKGKCTITNSSTAEMCKLTENAFRDVNIAFANELSIICEKLKINVWELIRLANLHPRVDILKPGPGVGGHCIAVDPWFIVNSAPSESNLIRKAREINDAKPKYVINQVIELSNSIDDPRIAFFGMTFKPNVDDFRESPSLEIIKSVSSKLKDISIQIVEPYTDNLDMLGGSKNTELVELNDAIEKANILVMLVDHDIFHDVSADRLIGKKIIDTRGFWAEIMEKNNNA